VRGDLANPKAAREARARDRARLPPRPRPACGGREEYWRANVEGTRVLLDACRAEGVPRFVFTSSPSVCFDGRGHLRAQNDLPYARRFRSSYSASKAEAERAVLAANEARSMTTCALRPHLIIGPRDPHLLPRLIERARARRLYVVGDGTNEVSLTWIDNAAEAHVRAGLALRRSARHAGRAYFIASGGAGAPWQWIRDLLAPPASASPRAAASPCTPQRRRRSVRGPLACSAPARRAAGDALHRAPASTSHSSTITTAAREDFGYRELVSMPEATARLVAHWRERGTNADQRTVPSTRS
jgi:nucleoside-diphosphate-sugar epimerase